MRRPELCDSQQRFAVANFAATSTTTPIKGHTTTAQLAKRIRAREAATSPLSGNPPTDFRHQEKGKHSFDF